MPNPMLLAKNSDLESFMQAYDPEEMPAYVASTGQTVLFGALANRDPAVRYAIANRLLDDGADATAVSSSGVTLPLVMLDQRDMGDTTEAAKVLRRLLDGGASVNASDPKRGAPLAFLYNNYNVPEDEALPLYDVFFSRPDLDLDAPATSKITVRQLIFEVHPDQKPVLQERARAYEQQHGATS